MRRLVGWLVGMQLTEAMVKYKAITMDCFSSAVYAVRIVLYIFMY